MSFLYSKNDWLSYKLLLSAGLISVLLFSPFSNMLFDVGGMYFFEGAITISIIASKIINDDIFEYCYVSFFSKENILLIFIISLVALIGVLMHGDVSAAYSDFRANIFLLFGFHVGRIIASANGLFLKYWTTAAMFSAILAVLHWRIASSGGIQGFEVKYPSAIFASVFCVAIFGDYKRTSPWILSILLLLFLAAVSSFRSYVLIGGFVVLYSLIRRRSVSSRALFITQIIAFSVAAYMVIFSDFMYSYYFDDESRYIQMIGKTDDVFSYLEGRSLGSDSDALRWNYLKFMFNDFFNLLIPNGLGSKAFYGSVGSMSDVDANTIDSAFLFMVFHYGWFLTATFLFYIFNVIRTKWLYVQWESFLLIPPIVIVGALDGSVFTITYKGFWFGLFFAYILFRVDKSKLI